MRLRLTLASVAVLITAALVYWYLHCPAQTTAVQPTPSYQASVIDPDMEGGMIEPVSGDFLLWGSDGVIMRSPNGVDWSQMQTPTTRDISDIASNTSGDRLVAVGHGGTIMTSTDKGYTWQMVTGLDTDTLFTTVLFVPHTNSWIAAGHSGTLAFSKDDPTEWVSSTSSITSHIFDLMIIPNTERILFGGEDGLLAMSKDGGHNWNIVPPDTTTPIRSFHQVNEITFGLSSEGIIAFTRDAGETWQMLKTDQRVHFNDVVYDSEHKTIVITSSGGNILWSGDNGHDWKIIDVPYLNYTNYLTDAVYDPATKRLLIFGDFGTVVQSVDGGLTWTSLDSGHKEHNKLVVYNPSSHKLVSAGVRGFNAVSTDLGQHWQILQPSLDYYWRDGVNTPDGGITLVGALGNILRSADRGAHFFYMPVTYPDDNTPPNYQVLRYNPKTKDLLAAGPTGVIMHSTDLGKSWELGYFTPFEQGEAFADLEIDTIRQTAFATEAFGGPYFSSDGSDTWERIEPLGDERQLWNSSLLSTKEHSVGVAVGEGGILAVSVDGGVSWQLKAPEALTGEDLYGSYADTSTNQLFIMGKGGQLLRSRDLGTTWERLESHTEHSLRYMSREPKQNALLCSGENGTLLRSTDDGATWVAITTEATDEIRDMVEEPGTQNILTFGRGGLIMRSEDAGLTWQTLPSHTTKHLRGAVFEQKSGDFIAFGERIVRLKRVGD